ncbi:hypothetical protein DLREEDagrD3_12530 [Denitratisoma sp. agr-D3]
MARNDGMKSVMRKGLLVGAIVLAAGAGWLASRAARHDGGHAVLPTVKAATVLAEGKQLPDFQLRGHGGAFSRRDLEGHWTFMFFGYTHCPDVCPTALSLMRDVRSRLAGGNVPLPGVVFVSVDGARDSQELLDRYVPAFDPSFIGVGGTDEALSPLVRALGVFYQRHEKEDPRNYTVDHSAAMYLIDPQGRLKAVFMPPVPADRMAADYQAIVAAAH